MSSTSKRRRGNQRLLVLIEFALREGWDVRRTPAGQLKLEPGRPPIFTRSTASDLWATRSK